MIVVISVLPREGLTINDLTKQLLRCVSKERNTAHQELIENDAHSPPVDRLPIALPQDHLRSDVLWSTTHLENKNTRLQWTASTDAA